MGLIKKVTLNYKEFLALKDRALDQSSTLPKGTKVVYINSRSYADSEVSEQTYDVSRYFGNVYELEEDLIPNDEANTYASSPDRADCWYAWRFAVWEQIPVTYESFLSIGE